MLTVRHLTMAKARVATRVKAAVGGQKSLNTSQDLVQLTERYNVFCKRLQGLIAALKAHFQSMQSLAKTRYSVRKIHSTKLHGEFRECTCPALVQYKYSGP